MRIFSSVAIERQFFDALELTNGDITKSAKRVGVHRDTVYAEANRNPAFKAKLEIAAVLDEIKCLGVMRDARDGNLETKTGKKEWRAAAWKLERRFWQTYGRRDPNAVTPEMLIAAASGIAGDLLEFVPVEKREEARQRIEARLSDLSKSIKDAGGYDLAGTEGGDVPDLGS
jgi:hypothetical protein